MTIPVNFFECFETLQEIKSDGNCISHSVNNSVHIICSYLEKKKLKQTIQLKQGCCSSVEEGVTNVEVSVAVSEWSRVKELV